ncbi:HTH domain-containing protein [Fundidesulfovibrio butyratiphilus]
MNKYTVISLAKDVLTNNNNTALTPTEIFEKALASGLDKKLTKKNKNPLANLIVQLRYNVEKKDSIFTSSRSRPIRYSLKTQYANENSASFEEEIDAEDSTHFTGYDESGLHDFLTWFAHSSMGNTGNLTIYTKTIRHTTSKKSSYGEWIHPDIVGFSFPFYYKKDLLSVFNSGNIVTFYSFEIKKAITLGTLREYYFQAVSNSSWANIGYLVAADVDENIIPELNSLSLSFGIGVIKLDLEEPEMTKIICPAQLKTNWDIERVNYLSGKNKDFNKFIENVYTDMESHDPHVERYNHVVSSEELKQRYSDWRDKQA